MGRGVYSTVFGGFITRLNYTIQLKILSPVLELQSTVQKTPAHLPQYTASEGTAQALNHRVNIGCVCSEKESECQGHNVMHANLLQMK